MPSMHRYLSRRSASRRSVVTDYPIFAERQSKEHPLLEDLVKANPPAGGLADFIDYLNGKTQSAITPRITEKELT